MMPRIDRELLPTNRGDAVTVQRNLFHTLAGAATYLLLPFNADAVHMRPWTVRDGVIHYDGDPVDSRNLWVKEINSDE